MRKSQIKFGNSFGSSFFMSKEDFAKKKAEKEREKMERNAREKENAIEELVESPRKVEKASEEMGVKPRKKKKSKETEQHEEITKKFDEMEEILMELQKKNDKKEKMEHTLDHIEEQSAKFEELDSKETTGMLGFPYGMGSLSSLKTVQQLQQRHSPYPSPKLSTDLLKCYASSSSTVIITVSRSCCSSPSAV